VITATSLNHPRLRIRLDDAMRKAADESCEHGLGIAHASGIDVVHVRNRAAAFRFFDARDNDITKTVIAALRSRANLEAA
jgi:hypothetical protein